VQHATIQLTDRGFEGFMVWEVYSRRWKKKHDPETHLCARVQRIQGVESEAQRGCPSCETTWLVSTEELDSDCSEPALSSQDFVGPAHMALGEVDPELEGVNPYPQQSLGWYLGWDGESVEPMGFAWDEAITLDPAEAATRGGDVWILWPGFAWRVGG